MDLLHDSPAFEKAIQPSEEPYRTKVVPLMHDSRWLVDDAAFFPRAWIPPFPTPHSSWEAPFKIVDPPYYREVYYNISMEDGYRYTMPDVLPGSPLEIPSWMKPAVHQFVRYAKSGVGPLQYLAERYVGLIPPTEPEDHDGELSEKDLIVEYFWPGLAKRKWVVYEVDKSGITTKLREKNMDQPDSDNNSKQ